MTKAVRHSLFALPTVRGGGGRRFAPVDIAVAHHIFYTEHKLSFARRIANAFFAMHFVARRRAFLYAEKQGW